MTACKAAIELAAAAPSAPRWLGFRRGVVGDDSRGASARGDSAITPLELLAYISVSVAATVGPGGAAAKCASTFMLGGGTLRAIRLVMNEIAAAVVAARTAVTSIIVAIVGIRFERPDGKVCSSSFDRPIENLQITPSYGVHNYIGRCKLCRAGVAVVDAAFGTTRAHDGVRLVVDYAIADPDGRVYRAIDNGSNSAAFHAGCKCGAWVTVRRVDGKVSEKHVCGARCLNSTGPSCECSCGGANHGRGFAS